MMFADVISRDHGCPWGISGLSTATWQLIAPTRVRIADLVATQPGVLFTALRRDAGAPVGGDPVPHVISYGGKLYLEDGHHRVVRRALRGKKYVWVRVHVMAEALVLSEVS